MDNLYLTNISQEVEKYGFCKVLYVRKKTIDIKHIFTEIFVRKNLNIEKELKYLGMSLFDYIEYMTNKIRHIYKCSRGFKNNIDEIVKQDRTHFFPTIKLYEGLKNIIVLDFDGVVTKGKFKDLYELCLERCYTVICSANPNITEEWFINKGLKLPGYIYSCKGKLKKIKQLLLLNLRYDNVFYIDNEEEYLKYAWIFGIETFLYKNNKIINYSLNK